MLTVIGPVDNPVILTWDNFTDIPTVDDILSNSVPEKVTSAKAVHGYNEQLAVLSDDIPHNPSVCTTVQSGLSTSVT